MESSTEEGDKEGTDTNAVTDGLESGTATATAHDGSNTVGEEGNVNDDSSPAEKEWHIVVEEKIGNVFRRYGTFVGHHPIPFIVLPILIFGGLGGGMAKLEAERDLEKLYFPDPSIALTHRQMVRDWFPDRNDVMYDSYAQSDPYWAALIFQAKDDGDVFDNETRIEIESVIQKVKDITVEIDSKKLSFEDICARRDSKCVVIGEAFLSPPLRGALKGGLVTFPFWTPPGAAEEVDLAVFIAKAKTAENSNILREANIIKIQFILKTECDIWENAFVATMETTHPTLTTLTYGATGSMSKELDKGTKGDISLFALTFVLLSVFSALASSGGDAVSTKASLANVGVAAAGLSIVGSFGIVSLCGVKFVGMVGIMPFLIIGIGVDDMFLLMSSWSETLSDQALSVPERMGETFAHAGIGITVTTVTDFISFAVGTSSKFRSITNFSIYAAVAVLFCYVLQITLFGGTLAMHGRRVYSQRHFLTFRVTKSVRELEDEGSSRPAAFLCGGEIPSHARQDECACQRSLYDSLAKLFDSSVTSIVIVLAFMGYLAASIYGAVNIQQGLLLTELVPGSSYYHAYLTQNKYFPPRLAIAFVVEGHYKDNYEVQMQELLERAQAHEKIRSDFSRCWLTDYVKQPYYSKSSFMPTLLTRFLPSNPRYYNDVVFDATNSSITASRCYVMSEPMDSQYEMADLMVRMRDLAATSALPVFPFHFAFVAFEQFLAILPATLQLMGIALAAIFVVCVIFLPHPLMVFLVTLTVAMILVGIFGFMYYWNTALSSITMIHLVMSVGFSVDFSAHVCTAYIVSSARTRNERARDAISHAASAIFNGGASSLIGVLVLVFSDSYIFVSFFRIMVLVIGFGMLHAVLFLPAVLSLIGPERK